MHIKRNKIWFGGRTAEDLIAEFGSPLYVYEHETIVDRLERLRRAFTWKKTRILYACKANTNGEILRLLKERGTGIDAVSPGEIHLALRAGFSPSDIMLTGTNLTRDDIGYSLGKGVLVNIDNISMIETHGELFRGKNVAIRVNPDVRAGGHAYIETGHKDSKFGLLFEDIPYLRGLLERFDAGVIGLHQHIGSDIVDAAPIVEGLEKLISVAAQFDSLQFIDIGGGFKVRYHDDDDAGDVQQVGAAVSERFSSFCREYGRDLELIIEPGKYLVSEGGFLLTTVQSVKRNDGRVFVGTDTGMNHLIRPALYHAHHAIVNASSVEGKQERADIVGNICESADILGKNRIITIPDVGSVLCIMNAGSYGYSMASNYNSRLLPAEIMVQNGTASLIRRRQRFEDLE
jgi:diaminopimelate decarboxylase